MRRPACRSAHRARCWPRPVSWRKYLTLEPGVRGPGICPGARAARPARGGFGADPPGRQRTAPCRSARSVGDVGIRPADRWTCSPIRCPTASILLVFRDARAVRAGRRGRTDRDDALGQPRPDARGRAARHPRPAAHHGRGAGNGERGAEELERRNDVDERGAPVDERGAGHRQRRAELEGRSAHRQRMPIFRTSSSRRPCRWWWSIGSLRIRNFTEAVRKRSSPCVPATGAGR